MTTRSARCSGTAFTDEQKKDALRLAKGLFESKGKISFEAFYSND